jgi:enamidase
MQVSREALKAGIEEAHRRGLKVTGHLCSVTYAEAADLGIDNLEHGFLASTDFIADKQPDVCPGQARGQQTIATLDESSAPFVALVRKLIEKRVALTSTLTVFETFTPGRPMPPGLDVLTPQLQDNFRRARERVANNPESVYTKLFPKAMALERAFAKAGGVLLAGTDPTGSGGVVPGYANQRQLELLVEEGFTPVEAIAIGTRNGARFPRPRGAHRHDRARETGRPRGRRWKSRDDDRRRAESADGVQARNGIRSGQADRVSEGAGRIVVAQTAQGLIGLAARPAASR